MIGEERQCAGAFEERSHHPQIGAPSRRSRVAVRNQITQRDGEQKHAVEIRVDRGLWKGNVEESGEERPSRQHRRANAGVVDERDGRDRAKAH